MTSRVSIKNKERKAKNKNSVKKKETKQRKKLYKETETSVLPGVEPSLSARSSNSLTTAPQVHTRFEKLILLYQNNFSLP